MPSKEVQVPQERFEFNPETMSLPQVRIFNSNITEGYGEDYNDKIDQDQRMQFAMEVERTANRERARHFAV